MNGKTTVDWTEPEGFRHERFPGRKLSSGTFALQGHDPKSVIYYKNIRCKPLSPDIDDSQEGWYSLFDGTLNGWKPSENFEAAIVGQNLLDTHHFEFFNADVFATEVDRGVYGMITVRR